MTKKTKLPFWATFLTIAGVIVLCALGFWQVERLQWKQDFIQQLENAYENSQSDSIDLSSDFAYGHVDGDLLTDKAILRGPKTYRKKIGYDLIVPLQMDDQTLLVNLGWTDQKDLKKLPIHHAKNNYIHFWGLLRKPSWNGFVPYDDPEHDQWFRGSPDAVAQAKGLKNILPFILYAERSSYEFYGAFPNNERQYPNNNHLQYALFWFSMAGALLVIYALRFLRD